MGPISIVALIASIAGVWLCARRMTRGLFLLAMSLLCLHLAATATYYFYAQTDVADTELYYFNRYGFQASIFGGGTEFTLWITQSLKDFGATYFDCFMAFQTIGFLGIMLLMRTIEEIGARMNSAVPTLAYVVLFLPSLHFWTSAIGKDAPLFFLLTLAGWSTIDLRNRLRYFLFAILLMTLFRAHIALLVVMSLSAAAFFAGTISLGRKIILLGVAAAAMVVVGISLQSTLGVDVSSAASVGAYLEERQAINQTVQGATAVGDLPFHLSLVSILTRPLFFDSEGMFGLVASAENLAVIAIVLYLLINFATIRQMSKKVLFIRFCIILPAAIILLLGMVYYNVGLGLRQRVMAFPGLLSLFAATLIFRHQLARPLIAAVARPAKASMPDSLRSSASA